MTTSTVTTNGKVVTQTSTSGVTQTSTTGGGKGNQHGGGGLLSTVLTVVNGNALVPFACNSDITCSGWLSLFIQGGGASAAAKKKHHTTSLTCTKKARFRVKAHRHATVKMKMSRACLTYMKKHHNKAKARLVDHSTTAGQKGFNKKVKLV